MTGFNTRRRGKVSSSAMEAQYRCPHCTRWRVGGVARYARHLVSHGLDFDPFPAYVTVDVDGYVVDHDGYRVLSGREPVRPPPGVGLIRSSPTSVREVPSW